MKFSDYFEHTEHLGLMISSSLSNGMDKLKRVQILVAAENTWQGIIGNTWPYSEEPLLITGQFSTKFTESIVVDLNENLWKRLEGKTDFEECLTPQYKCASIFDPRPNKTQ